VSVYWRLSLIYACYFAALGAFLPYWPAYLKTLGFGAADIGLLLALPQLTKLVAPNLIGYAADMTRQRRRLVLLAAFLSALVFTVGAKAAHFWSMAAMLLGFSFFWNAIISQYETVTLSQLGEQRHRYPRVRLWGSIGFIVIVLLLGWLFDSVAMSWLPWMMVALLWMLWLASFGLPKDQRISSLVIARGSVLKVLRQPGVLLFFLCTFLMQVSHGSYYTFYTIYLQQLGFPSLMISLLWCLGVVAEISLFLVLHRFLKEGSWVRIMRWSLALTVLRWWMIGSLADHLVWLLLAQLLHAASFASFHAACVSWVQARFGERLAGQGQALYSSFAMGAGWTVGAWVAGFSWVAWQGGSFLLMAVIALAGFLVSLRVPSARPS
jgi:PPP family 3-phenylpropionic acid transporter